MKARLVVIALMWLPSMLFAIDAGKAFEDPVLQQRYEKIIEEVRCLKCQNQTIKDSNAFLADDLRREIRRLLSEGKTDQEIFDFLVERYGQFALYRPAMNGITLVLWLAPFIFIFVGIIVVYRVLRKRSSMPIDLEDEVAAKELAG